MASIIDITNPLTGAVEKVDQLDHTAQEIDDAIARALPGGAIDIALQNKTPILQEIPVITLRPEDMTDVQSGKIVLSKIGNMVSFNMNIRPGNDQVEYEKIYAVLPEGYRPIVGLTFPACNGQGTSLYGEIDTYGNVRFYSRGTTGFISANLMFFSV